MYLMQQQLTGGAQLQYHNESYNFSNHERTCIMAVKRPRTIRVMFTRSNTFWSQVIRTFTVSRYSHVAIILPDDSVIDTDHPQGVSTRDLNTLIGESQEYEIIKVPVKNPRAAYDFLREQLNKPYDYGGVFSFIVKRNWQDPNNIRKRFVYVLYLRRRNYVDWYSIRARY